MQTKTKHDLITHFSLRILDARVFINLSFPTIGYADYLSL